MRIVLLLTLLSAPATAQITYPPHRPPVHRPSPGRATPPAIRLPPLPARQASATRAYALSTVATLGGAALGAGLVHALPDAEVLGWIVAGGALAVGPAVGNWTLGAEEDLGRALTVKVGGVVVAAITTPVAVGLCALDATGDGACGARWIPIAVAGAGLAAGAAIDLATIPRNACRAQDERSPSPVTVAPTAGGLAVRIPL